MHLDLAIVAGAVIAALWFLGSALYIGMSWRESVADMRVSGRRRLLLLDLLVIVLWPLLLVIDYVRALMRKFVTARKR